MTNEYTLVDLATDIYMVINDNLSEADVRMNLSMIPDLCDMFADKKTALNGVYLGVKHDISLVVVDDKSHLDTDYDLKFYEEIVQKGGISFLERHVALIRYDKFIDIPYMEDIFECCENAGFIVD